MAISRILAAVIATSILIGLSGFVIPKKQETSQVYLRSMQTRAFDTTDEKKTLRTVISTLQDLDFLIDEANKVLGVVSATRWDEKHKFLGMTSKGRPPRLQITVTVRPKGETQVFVRANMEYGFKGVEDPSVYQKFFTYLEKSMFPTAHEVD